MENVAEMANKILVMNEGKVFMKGYVGEIFNEVEKLEQIGLGVPKVTYLMRKLKKKGFDINDKIYTLEEAKKELIKFLSKGDK